MDYVFGGEIISLGDNGASGGTAAYPGAGPLQFLIARGLEYSAANSASGPETRVSRVYYGVCIHFCNIFAHYFVRHKITSNKLYVIF